MKKVLIVILVVLIALPAAAFLMKDAIIQSSASAIVKAATGLGLEMKSLKTSLSMIEIQGLKVFNPEGFEDKTMLDMPEVYVQYDLPAIIGGKAHLPQLRINLASFEVVKTKSGALNLDSLKAIQNQKKQATTGEKPKALPIQIDTLELKIGKVIYKDYSRGGSPSVQEFNLNIDEKFTNVTDFNAVTSIIVLKAMMNTTLGQLTNIDLGGLKNSLGGSLSSAQGLALESAQQAQKVLSGGVSGVQGAAGGVGNVIGGGLKSLKLPFGSSDDNK